MPGMALAALPSSSSTASCSFSLLPARCLATRAAGLRHQHHHQRAVPSGSLANTCVRRGGEKHPSRSDWVASWARLASSNAHERVAAAPRVSRKGSVTSEQPQQPQPVLNDPPSTSTVDDQDYDSDDENEFYASDDDEDVDDAAATTTGDFDEEEYWSDLDEDEDEDGEEAQAPVAMEDERAVLSDPQFNEDVTLHAFRVTQRNALVVRLDKLSDQYGSPTLEEISAFSRAYNARLEEAVVEGAIPSTYSVEVSSPGAERAVAVPHQLERFKALPMRVNYSVMGSEATSTSGERSEVLDFVSLDEDGSVTHWRLANVKVNRGEKGKGLSKKQRERILDIPVSAIQRVNLHLDF
eukprot:jgi/Chlat1/2774/Chrsp187S02946